MNGIIALYNFVLAAFVGYEVISRVPVILHTPLMSGSNFVHGIVLVGAMVALGNATTTREKQSASSACCSRPAMRQWAACWHGLIPPSVTGTGMRGARVLFPNVGTAMLCTDRR